MPLDGWDHVELWVGNAKQAAYYYEHAFGFARTAYAGPETGVRDRASYVLEQNEIRLVISSSLRRAMRSATSRAHGDGVKDISLRVPDASEAYRQAVQRGARGIIEPKTVEDEFGKVVLATIGTYGDVVHTFVDRHAYEGAYLPGYVAREPSRREAGVGLLALDHVVGNVELGRMEHWVEFYERVFGMTEMIHFSDEDISTEYSALMSKVMTDGQGKVKFPINEPAEGKRKSQIEEYLEFNHGPGSSTSRCSRRTSSRRSRRCNAAACCSSRRPTPTTTRRQTESARSTRAGTTCGGCASSPTATTTATCSRSSRRPRRTGRRCSSR